MEAVEFVKKIREKVMVSLPFISVSNSFCVLHLCTKNMFTTACYNCILEEVHQDI